VTQGHIIYLHYIPKSCWLSYFFCVGFNESVKDLVLFGGDVEYIER
jgi:hypothetical protein